MEFKFKDDSGSVARINLKDFIEESKLPATIAGDLCTRFEMGLIPFEQLTRNYHVLSEGIEFPGIIVIPESERLEDIYFVNDNGRNYIHIGDRCISVKAFCEAYPVAMPTLLRNILDTRVPEEDRYIFIELILWKHENNLHPTTKVKYMVQEDGSLFITNNQLIAACTGSSYSTALVRIKRWLSGDLCNKGLTAPIDQICKKKVGKPNWRGLSSESRSDTLTKITTGSKEK